MAAEEVLAPQRRRKWRADPLGQANEGGARLGGGGIAPGEHERPARAGDDADRLVQRGRSGPIACGRTNLDFPRWYSICSHWNSIGTFRTIGRLSRVARRTATALPGASAAMLGRGTDEREGPRRGERRNCHHGGSVHRHRPRPGNRLTNILHDLTLHVNK